MNNNKGQALVEFVLVLPVIIILIFGMIELGNMIHKKYQLETHMDSVIELYKAGKTEVIDSYATTNDITINFQESGSLVTAVIEQKINLITPGIDIIIDNPYTIRAKRSFYIDKDDSVTTSE